MAPPQWPKNVPICSFVTACSLRLNSCTADRSDRTSRHRNPDRKAAPARHHADGRICEPFGRAVGRLVSRCWCSPPSCWQAPTLAHPAAPCTRARGACSRRLAEHRWACRPHPCLAQRLLRLLWRRASLGAHRPDSPGDGAPAGRRRQQGPRRKARAAARTGTGLRGSSPGLQVQQPAPVPPRSTLADAIPAAARSRSRRACAVV
jgi:hypothetical protein